MKRIPTKLIYNCVRIPLKKYPFVEKQKTKKTKTPTSRFLNETRNTRPAKYKTRIKTILITKNKSSHSTGCDGRTTARPTIKSERDPVTL